MVSGADRHAHDWHQRLRIPGAEALTLKQAYKAMAWLGEITNDDRPMTFFILPTEVVDNWVNGSIEICGDPPNPSALFALMKIWAARSY